MQILVKLQNSKTMKEFIELVREMRNAQKEYFKTRSKDVLNRSKELERKVGAEQVFESNKLLIEKR